MPNLTPTKTFLAGIAAGFLVLCTVGFFIMLGIYFSGSPSSKVGAEEGSTVATDEYPEQFSQCLDSGKYASTVSADMNLGASLGVQGTPATFINGYLLSGALPIDMISQVIDSLLAGEEPDFDFLKDQAGEILKVDMPELLGVVWRGNEDASISLVTWSDFECPYCARFAPAVEQVLAKYGDKVRFTFRHFPLSFHTQAQKAAEAYECAKEQSQPFEMHDKLFELSNAGTLSVENFKKAASELGLE